MLSHFFPVLFAQPAGCYLVKHSLIWFCSFHFLLLPLGPALQPTHVCSCQKKRGCDVQVSKQQRQRRRQLLAHTVKYLICFRHPPGAALKVELSVVIIVVMFVLYSRCRLSDSIGVHRERRSTRHPKCSLTPFAPQGTFKADNGGGKRKTDSHRTDDFSLERK